MSAQQKRFQHQCSEAVASSEALIEQLNKYSDVEQPTDGDVTQATALHNAIRGIVNLCSSINSHAR